MAGCLVQWKKFRTKSCLMHPSGNTIHFLPLLIPLKSLFIIKLKKKIRRSEFNFSPLREFPMGKRIFAFLYEKISLLNLQVNFVHQLFVSSNSNSFFATKFRIEGYL